MLQDEGHPVYFVVEVTKVHIFCLNPLAKVESVFPEMSYVRIFGIAVNSTLNHPANFNKYINTEAPAVTDSRLSGDAAKRNSGAPPTRSSPIIARNALSDMSTGWASRQWPVLYCSIG